MAGLGDKSTASEVKLLTLWAAFEALLPNVPDVGGSRIAHFLEYIVPAAILSYARDSFIEFSRDAERVHGDKYREFLKALPIDDELLPDRLALVVMGGDGAQKHALCSVFTKNPLALYRLKTLEEKFSCPEDFEKAFQSADFELNGKPSGFIVSATR